MPVDAMQIGNGKTGKMSADLTPGLARSILSRRGCDSIHAFRMGEYLSQPGTAIIPLVFWSKAMSNPTHACLGFSVLGLLLAGSALAEGQPSLSQAQSECRSIAQQQTGYDPNAAPSTTTTQPQAGGRARGAAAGAMAGAVKGKSKANQYGNVPDQVAEEYTRNQMQDAAKMGTAVGASRQRQQRRQDTKSQQQAQQQQSSAANAYNQAYSACMAGKGFPGQ